jgi:adenylate cyclase
MGKRTSWHPHRQKEDGSWARDIRIELPAPGADGAQITEIRRCNALTVGILWLVCLLILVVGLTPASNGANASRLDHMALSSFISMLMLSTHSSLLIELARRRPVLSVLWRERPACPFFEMLRLSPPRHAWLIAVSVCLNTSLFLLNFAPEPSGSYSRYFALFISLVGIAFDLYLLLNASLWTNESADLPDGSARDWPVHSDSKVIPFRPEELDRLSLELNYMFRELHETHRLKETFGIHVGSEAAEHILAGSPSQGGAEETLTVMFCDIRDYTLLCSRQPLASTVRLLNAFFSVMVRIVEEVHGGMINQLTGDGFMALFGAHGYPQHHADAALRAGRDMLAALKEINADIVACRVQPLAIGIGIHTGPAIIGSVGSPLVPKAKTSAVLLCDSYREPCPG